MYKYSKSKYEKFDREKMWIEQQSSVERLDLL